LSPGFGRGFFFKPFGWARPALCLDGCCLKKSLLAGELSISDIGSGMTVEQQAKLFDRSTRFRRELDPSAGNSHEFGRADPNRR
jgi:hypothetical protein